MAQGSLETLEVQILPPVPCSIIISGASKAGKTHLATNSIILNHEWLWPGQKVRKCIVVYRFYQEYFHQLEQYFGPEKLLLTKCFSEDLLSEESIGRGEEDGICFLILDDCFHEYMNSPALLDVFVSRVHHQNLVSIAICHDLYAGSKGNSFQTIKKNTSAIIVMRQATIGATLIELQKSLFPGQGGLLTKAFRLAVNDQATYNSNVFGYLVIDSSLECDPRTRLRTGLTENEKRFCYVTD